MIVPSVAAPPGVRNACGNGWKGTFQPFSHPFPTPGLMCIETGSRMRIWAQPRSIFQPKPLIFRQFTHTCGDFRPCEEVGILSVVTGEILRPLPCETSPLHQLKSAFPAIFTPISNTLPLGPTQLQVPLVLQLHSVSRAWLRNHFLVSSLELCALHPSNLERRKR